ncbi:hypothetical protein HU200_006345 [Digitaria exilis]|uniref:Uncharacterized protein n=1 Tax=Digitaria exilis TaxID=1010633 RepID=A0A835FSX2_9POAL|nr:hypothetical protein HU200_006345 [Digitaria exilis]
MEQGAQQNGVVNMTRAMEALSPLLNNPRRTIVWVETLVTAAAALLFLPLVLGSYNRRWNNSAIKGVLSVSNSVMFPLIVYTLSVMQSSPIKCLIYPVWAASLIIASGGTSAIKQYDFRDSNNMISFLTEMARYCAYLIVFVPELLPYHISDIRHLRIMVLEEASEILASYPLFERYQKMKGQEATDLEAEDPSKMVFMKGVKLGKQLERMQNGQHWKVMADFWAETINLCCTRALHCQGAHAASGGWWGISDPSLGSAFPCWYPEP